jgi:hypothetical protein
MWFEIFRPTMWDTLSFEFFCYGNSIKLQKIILKGEFSWVMSSHWGNTTGHTSESQKVDNLKWTSILMSALGPIRKNCFLLLAVLEGTILWP